MHYRIQCFLVLQSWYVNHMTNPPPFTSWTWDQAMAELNRLFVRRATTEENLFQNGKNYHLRLQSVW